MDQSDRHRQGDWTFLTNHSHILNSKCTAPLVCAKTRATLPERPRTTRQTANEFYELRELVLAQANLCTFCKYDLVLAMAHLPDMTHPANRLRIEHGPSGFAIEFNALDALAPVLIHPFGLPTTLKVAESETWLRTRRNSQYTKNVMNADFDWTFSTDYGGSFWLAGQLLRPDQPPLSELIEPTEQRIDVDKLRVRKQIHFFDEVELFEDELADHGTAQYSVKIRVHDDCFFVLARFFLRVDRVFVRYFDTRLYHEFGQDYLLRELSHRESAIPDLTAPEAQALLTQPQELCQYVPQKELRLERIRLPASSR